MDWQQQESYHETWAQLDFVELSFTASQCNKENQLTSYEYQVYWAFDDTYFSAVWIVIMKWIGKNCLLVIPGKNLHLRLFCDIGINSTSCKFVKKKNNIITYF